MSETPKNDWDPRDASVIEDQRRAYDGMRERCPVAHSEFMGWSVFRHGDIEAVLADTETYSNASRFLAIPNGMDPPMHSRYRAALEPLFNDERMNKLEPQARKIIGDQLERVARGEGFDFIESVATPFALKTLCAMLGWPEQQWECLGGWTHGNQQAAFTQDPAAGKALHSLFSGHVKENLQKHRDASKADADATNALLQTEVDGERLDDDAIVSVLRNWTAGHGTVVAGLSILVLHLAQQRELQDRLRGDPSLIPAAIEEILRSDGPLVANRRTTMRDVEIQGRTIPKGNAVALMWIAANRDPETFDDPATIDVERDTEASLLWGRGIHLCQGAPLARLEMRVALEELLARTQHFELSDAKPRRAVYPGNGLAFLPLRLH